MREKSLADRVTNREKCLLIHMRAKKFGFECIKSRKMPFYVSKGKKVGATMSETTEKALI